MDRVRRARAIDTQVLVQAGLVFHRHVFAEDRFFDVRDDGAA